jgi:SAM-dependent methyltransferase
MDPLELYRWAVQDPETHAEVLRIMYLCQNPGRPANVLREDFAGTCADSVAWVALREGRRAVAVDLDGPTIAWARQRAERILGGRAKDVEFIVSDVLDVGPPRTPRADIIAALNFSVFYFRDRETLHRYFKHAGECLAPRGLLVLNLFGGADAMQPRTTTRTVTPTPRLPNEEPVPPFEYIWEERSYDPGSAAMDSLIHFRVPDSASPGGDREIRDAFRYDWRLWPIEELIGELHAAGFDDVEVWRHTYDAAEGGEGLFLGPVPLSELAALDYWTAYLLASRTTTEAGVGPGR